MDFHHFPCMKLKANNVWGLIGVIAGEGFGLNLNFFKKSILERMGSLMTT